MYLASLSVCFLSIRMFCPLQWFLLSGKPVWKSLLIFCCCWKTFNNNSSDYFWAFKVSLILSRKSFPNNLFPVIANNTNLPLLKCFSCIELCIISGNILSCQIYEITLLVWLTERTVWITIKSNSTFTPALLHQDMLHFEVHDMDWRKNQEAVYFSFTFFRSIESRL